MTGDIRGLPIGILPHLYEEDLTVAPEVHAALEEASGVFGSLGATLEEIRIRPAADYYAVKITIAELTQCQAAVRGLRRAQACLFRAEPANEVLDTTSASTTTPPTELIRRTDRHDRGNGE